MAIKDNALDLELNRASDFWGREIQLALDSRFGKDKVGFMLILATSGEGGKMSLKTSLKLTGAVAFLKELAFKVEHGLTGRVTIQ